MENKVPQMTLEQALSNLEQAASMARLTSQEHEILKFSAQMIRDSWMVKKDEKSS